MKLNREQLDLLQQMADEAHNDATNKLFEICKELRVDQDMFLKGGGVLGEWQATVTRPQQFALAWVDRVFEFMTLVDEIRQFSAVEKLHNKAAETRKNQPMRGKIAGGAIKASFESPEYKNRKNR